MGFGSGRSARILSVFRLEWNRYIQSICQPMNVAIQVRIPTKHINLQDQTGLTNEARQHK